MLQVTTMPTPASFHTFIYTRILILILYLCVHISIEFDIYRIKKSETMDEYSIATLNGLIFGGLIEFYQD